MLGSSFTTSSVQMAAFTARQSTACFLASSSAGWRQACLPVLRYECRRLPNQAVLPYPCRLSHGRRSASSLGGDQPYRNNSTGRNGFWTTGRVSFVVALTGVFTYLYTLQQPALHARARMFFPQGLKKPQYGSKKDMDNVRLAKSMPTMQNCRPVISLMRW